MIISRTPFRISFFGGGTDYPSWYHRHGGSVLSATIDKYCYLTCRYLPPFFEHRHRVVYSKIEMTSHVEQIQHPAVREILKMMQIDRGVEIHHDGDLPARSGMGSSSSFVVGLLNALHALKGRMPSKSQLAKEAIYVEQQLLKETVGSQDQTAAAYGGLNNIFFMQNGEIQVRPVTIPPARISQLDSHVMLFYTCIKRTAADVAKTYAVDISTRKRQLRILSDMVEEGIYILNGNAPIQDFGELLHEAWMTKRSLSSAVTNDHVDQIYARAREAGAIGGKLTGAGGGGFMMLFVPPAAQEQLVQAFPDLIHVPFSFESSGSQIIFCDVETDYSNASFLRDGQPTIVFREQSEISTPATGFPYRPMLPLDTTTDRPLFGTSEPA